MTLVAFIVPVRHPDNARDWSGLMARLSETVRSIAAQRHPDWRGIVVANEGAELPPLPDKFSVRRVTFPRNDIHELDQGCKAAFLDAFRADKGRRVLAGMLDARDSRFTMICDDDDLVSNRIVEHVARQPSSNGWIVTHGWLWDDGGRFLLKNNDFNHRCGTCLIVRRDLYEIPEIFEEADLEWIKDSFGSHHRIDKKLAARGTPLCPLPFRGAVYRVGNAGSHSGSSGILSQAFLNGSTIRRPDRFFINLLRLRWIGRRHRVEFFGR